MASCLENLVTVFLLLFLHFSPLYVFIYFIFFFCIFYFIIFYYICLAPPSARTSPSALDFIDNFTFAQPQKKNKKKVENKKMKKNKRRGGLRFSYVMRIQQLRFGLVTCPQKDSQAHCWIACNLPLPLSPSRPLALLPSAHGPWPPPAIFFSSAKPRLHVPPKRCRKQAGEEDLPSGFYYRHETGFLPVPRPTPESSEPTRPDQTRSRPKPKSPDSWSALAPILYFKLIY